MASQHRVIALGKYALTGKLLGEGSFSKVREADDRETGSKVALKIMDMKALKSEIAEKCCKREALILSQICHPNVIRMLDCFKTHTRCIIVMEIMPLNMCEFIERQRECKLREPLSRRIFRQIVAAIEYLHERNIVHRDVKLENVLIDPEKNNLVKLTDFGLSTEWNKEEFLHTNCGSAEYSAPELHERSHYTSAVDIWALGVVLFAMFVGRLPFDVATRPVTPDARRELFLEEMRQGIKTKKHQNQLIASSVDLRNLLSCLLHTDWKQRITIGEVRQHKWLMFKMVPIPAKITANASTQVKSIASETFRPLTAMEGISINRIELIRNKPKTGIKAQLTTDRGKNILKF